MTLKQAIRIVENHNKWRRDNNVPPKTKMGDAKKLGEKREELKKLLEKKLIEL